MEVALEFERQLTLAFMKEHHARTLNKHTGNGVYGYRAPYQVVVTVVDVMALLQKGYTVRGV